eukprot:CAMPEP_0184341148 /NCGR_PEP_ID=MMETSP1089-20130417/9775_1 /TAXON_ID=38269 ORGANISM="Gloeochaete wittrockiana, Strain SAG46.84" /NCGR_SAMPLE_ID=MMETSP1089 /ASSEMBLY_ACC=CAM_ASM_000445 /LENGTH=410 /DNA_ID=CAMNT_0026669289 /DNA_START=82 /DNA_END=1314 /DNA_ORIENTATION=-
MEDSEVLKSPRVVGLAAPTPSRFAQRQIHSSRFGIYLHSDRPPLVSLNSIRLKSFEESFAHVYNVLARVVPALVFCTASVCLLVVNKHAALKGFNTFTLLFFQNLTVLSCFYSQKVLNSKKGYQAPFSLDQAAQWLPAAILFQLNIFSSVEALKYLSVPSIVVFRNLAILFTCLAEYFFCKQMVPNTVAASLVVIVLSTLWYGAVDIERHYPGYYWGLAHVSCITGYSITVRWLLRYHRFTALNTILLNNVECLPGLLLGMFLTKGGLILPSMARADHWCVLASCILAVLVMGSALQARKMMSARTFLILTHFNKIPIIYVGTIVFANSLTLPMGMALAVSVTGAMMYSFHHAKEREKQATKEVEAQMFSVQEMLERLEEAEVSELGMNSGAQEMMVDSVLVGDVFMHTE